MDNWHELWDTVSANLVASYDTWALAPEKIQQASVQHPLRWFDNLALAEEHDDELDPVILAEGRAILDVIRMTSISS